MQNNFKNLFGCSQGRLVNSYNGELQCFPNKCWIEEFRLANKCGLDFIEFLLDEKHNKDNPIWQKEGIAKIVLNLEKYNLNPYSACFSFIIKNSIFDKNKNDINIKYVIEAINEFKKIGLKLIILPLLEQSDFLLFDPLLVKKVLNTILDECKKYNIKLALESQAESNLVLDIINSINNPNLGYVYDTGNRAAIHNPEFEIKEFDKLIFHVHLKDILDKKNVVIGKGIVDFKKVLSALKSVNYKGKYNFETNRGINPFETMNNNIKFIRNYLFN